MYVVDEKGVSSVCCEECDCNIPMMGCLLYTRKVCLVSAVRSVMQYTCRWDVCCRQRKVCLVSAVRSVLQYTNDGMFVVDRERCV